MRDLLRRVLGWLSAAPPTAFPCLMVGQVKSLGMTGGEVGQIGNWHGQVGSIGMTVGEVEG